MNIVNEPSRFGNISIYELKKIQDCLSQTLRKDLAPTIEAHLVQASLHIRAVLEFVTPTKSIPEDLKG